MRVVFSLLAASGLVACTAQVPDSGADFDRYQDQNTYRAEREQVLNGSEAPLPFNNQPVSTTSLDAPETGLPSSVAAAVEEVNATEPTTQPREVVLNNPSISDEQDFDAVAGRESIESDAERLKAQKQAYQLVQPTALPSRTSSGGPNIVQYALQSRNAVGQKVYRRSFANQARFQRNCAKYASSDMAQEDFLKLGGPQRDRKGLDPDGDGYACFWDPTPFRKLATNG